MENINWFPSVSKLQKLTLCCTCVWDQVWKMSHALV